MFSCEISKTALGLCDYNQSPSISESPLVEQSQTDNRSGYMPTQEGLSRTVQAVKPHASWLLGKAWSALSTALEIILPNKKANEQWLHEQNFIGYGPGTPKNETHDEWCRRQGLIGYENTDQIISVPMQAESVVMEKKVAVELPVKPKVVEPQPQASIKITAARPSRIPRPIPGYVHKPKAQGKPAAKQAPVTTDKQTTTSRLRKGEKTRYGFDSVVRKPYYLQDRVPREEQIRKLNGHMREAEFRTPGEQAARPEIKPIRKEAYARLLGNKDKRKPETVQPEAPKKVFSGDLHRLMKPLQGQQGKQYVSRQEWIDNWPKTLRT